MTTAAPITMPQHPLLFAIWQTNSTHISVVPSTTMCRSNKVSKYQLIFLWIHLLLTISSTSSRRPRGAINCLPHLTLPIFDVWGIFNTSTARSSGDIWVRHRVCKHFACWFYLTLSVLFFRRFIAPPITPTSHPIHHPVVLKSHCEKMRRHKGKKWFAILLANACKLTC